MALTRWDREPAVGRHLIFWELLDALVMLQMHIPHLKLLLQNPQPHIARVCVSADSSSQNLIIDYDWHSWNCF